MANDNSTNRSFEVELRVPFHDLDPLHIVWHGNYLKYFDIARFALFENAGIDLYAYYQRTGYLFPVIKTSTKYIVPLKYGDLFRCRATVREASIKIVTDFVLRRAEDGEICARGRGEQVALKPPDMEMEFEIPEDIRSALGF
ncbi:MAG: thioesterase [Deltaproteobacteria bacterium SG8_13]|nr:MAG: thioesterase [Deltaproteobacteria bacterium SG8_13]